MPDISFKFSPYQYVTVSLFGLGHEGRVNRCTYAGQHNMYDVEFCNEGKLERREFAEDELAEADARKPLFRSPGFSFDARDIADSTVLKANSERIGMAVSNAMVEKPGNLRGRP